MPGEVYILGGYQTDFARNWTREGKHVVAGMTEVILGGLDTVEIDPDEVQTIHVGNFAGELYAKQGHLGAFALEAHPSLRGKPTARHEAACASGSIAMLAASAEIEAGRYDLAMVVGVEQMKTVSAAEGGDFLGTAAWYEREAVGRDFPFPRLFGKLGAEYVRRFEIPMEEYQAYLSDLMYRNARNNPRAQTRGWVMSKDHALREDNFNTRISEEIKISDCSQVTDGAVSLFLASERYAREYAQRHGLKLEDIPVIQGWGHSTAPIELTTKLEEGRKTDYVLPHARRAIVDAYRGAGISGPDDIDCIEFHDCFTTTAYAAVDLVGITKPGENFKAIEEGWLEMNGRYPLNPSGGLIGAGHPVGATGVRMALDLYRQMTESAGGYQVPLRNRRALQVNIGGSGTTVVAMVIGTH